MHFGKLEEIVLKSTIFYFRCANFKKMLKNYNFSNTVVVLHGIPVLKKYRGTRSLEMILYQRRHFACTVYKVELQK